MSDLPKRLRIKAGMIDLGEKIAWGSETALMEEAADVIEGLSAENKRLRDTPQHARDSAELRRLCAERDTLKSELAALKSQPSGVDERAAFEAAVCERYGYTGGSIISRRVGDYYADASLSQAWALWKARAALSAPAAGQDVSALVEALADLSSGVRSVNRSRQHLVSVSDEHPRYWQREEWINWILELADAADAALAAHKAGGA